MSNDLPLPSSEPATSPDPQGANQAADVIRQKVGQLYGKEPPAKEEIQEIEDSGAHSKHQKFMQDLTESGKSLAEVQTAWHNYYIALTDIEKHKVWQEFYANHARATKYLQHTDHTKTPPVAPQPLATARATKAVSGTVDRTPAKARTVAEVKDQILQTVTSRGKLQKKHHIQSLLFGMSMGLIVIMVFMFSFFNEKFIAPLVTPSRVVSTTPIIVDPAANSVVGPEPKVIIPKINTEVPVVYGLDTINEDVLQNGLEAGAVHYPTSPVPGQSGNVVIVGHSSSNIFNRGKYKFAFVLLNRVQEGDTFYLNYNNQRYVYKIYSKKIVKPNEVSVLGPAERPNSATLITCDPPGQSTNRLVLVGEQISPDPKSNVASTAPASTEQTAIVPGNSISLFQRFFGWL